MNTRQAYIDLLPLHADAQSIESLLSIAADKAAEFARTPMDVDPKELTALIEVIGKQQKALVAEMDGLLTALSAEQRT